MNLHLENGNNIGKLEKAPASGDPYKIVTSLELCKKQENLYITYKHFKSATDSSVIDWRVNNITYTPSVQAKGCTGAPVDTKASVDTKAPVIIWSSLASPPKLYYILGGGGLLLTLFLAAGICCCGWISNKIDRTRRGVREDPNDGKG